MSRAGADEPRGEELTGDGELFRVLINDEEQYSLWPASKEVPAGWRSVHGPDGKESCLAYVEKHWIDVRPKSLRREMDR